MAKKVKIGTILLGLAGVGTVAYAFLRSPLYLFDGAVKLCEGADPAPGLWQNCRQVVLDRAGKSGEIRAPFDGRVHSKGTAKVDGKDAEVYTIVADKLPVRFTLTLIGGTLSKPLMGGFRTGEVIGQAQQLRASAERVANGQVEGHLPPSAWLIANGLAPASVKGPAWCQQNDMVVPPCPGAPFLMPELPKLSFRSVRMRV